jgi:HK97 family phage prohead protease
MTQMSTAGINNLPAAAKKFGIDVSESGGRSHEWKEDPGMSSIERRFTLVPVELRADGGQSRIGGYAAMFNKVSQNLGGFVEVVERSFFNKSRGDGWPDVMARYNHDDNMLLGTTGAGTLKLAVDDTGLSYDVVPPQSRADVVELVTRGDVRKSSFAFRVPAAGEDWGLSDQGYPMRHLVTGQLVDVAPVNAPAYLDTTAALRSLAAKMEAPVDEVRSAAETNELHRFFKVSSGAPMPKAKPKLLGAAAMMALLGRREDPYLGD